MKKSFFALALSVLLTGNSLPQKYSGFETGFSTIFEKSERVNSYYFGNNPAYLNQEQSTELLSLKSLYNNTSGEYKRFLDPDIRKYSLTASGKKFIDSLQVFKGDFSFERKENNNWEWIFSRDYSGDNSFILGDSTTGNTRYNGIMMNAEYSALLSDIFLLGFSIMYNVDEGLKQIAPHPTSRNRELNFTTGFGFNITNNFTAGITAAVYDDVEKLMYREDAGALNVETIILKFRGLDYPNIYRKKSETRHTYNNGYSAGLNFTYANESSLKISGFFDAGFKKYTVKDDENNPLSEGFSKNNHYRGGLLSNYSLNKSVLLGLSYKFNMNDNWAQYPEFKVVYGNSEVNSHAINLGLQYLFTEAFSAGIETGLSLWNEEINDYYSIISLNKTSSKYSINLGCTYKWNNQLFTFLSAGTGSENISEGSIQNNINQSSYFTNYRIKDLTYRLIPEQKYDINFVTSYVPGFGGEILFNINYLLLNSGTNTYLNNVNRNNLSLYVEYRVKAY